MVKTNDIFPLFVCKWHSLLFSAESAGSRSVSQRGVPKIRQFGRISLYYLYVALFFAPIGGWDAPQKVAHCNGPIEGKGRGAPLNESRKGGE